MSRTFPRERSVNSGISVLSTTAKGASVKWALMVVRLRVQVKPAPPLVKGRGPPGIGVKIGGMRFEGKAAVVSGAGSGIGAAVAIMLAGEGASLVLCGRRPAPLEETRAACERAGARAVAVPLDVREEAALSAAFDRAASLGPVEAAIACHGINSLARAEEVSLGEWNTILSTNLTGAFLFAREAARRMRPLGAGKIVLVSSVSGRPGHRKYPGFAAYAASKYGLTGLVEVLATELEGSGVGISLVCPGGVETEMFRRTFPGSRAALSPGQVGAAILDLADPRTAPPSGSIVDLP